VKVAESPIQVQSSQQKEFVLFRGATEERREKGLRVLRSKTPVVPFAEGNT
jgi:hypothetical protein